MKVVAEKVSEDCEYISAGKEYKVLEESDPEWIDELEGSHQIIDEEGDLLVIGCPFCFHIYGTWEFLDED